MSRQAARVDRPVRVAQRPRRTPAEPAQEAVEYRPVGEHVGDPYGLTSCRCICHFVAEKCDDDMCRGFAKKAKPEAEIVADTSWKWNDSCPHCGAKTEFGYCVKCVWVCANTARPTPEPISIKATTGKEIS